MKKKLLRSAMPFILFSIAAFTSCKKEGLEGKNTALITPEHHGNAIASSTVYVKFNAVEFPGENISNYDASFTASSGQTQVRIENLEKGNYYLYAIGYDSSIAQTVKGGIPIKISTKSGTNTFTIPVTEGH